MNIIALIGKTKSGKTATLKHLMVKMLGMNGTKPLYASRHYSTVPSKLSERIKAHWKTQHGNVSDISVVLKYNGKIICITSFGDSLKYDILPILDKTIRLFGHCEVFVCGRHSNNDLNREFARYSPDRIVTVNKERSTHVDDFTRDNIYAADSLLFEIEKLIS